jgi:hypothetical protein
MGVVVLKNFKKLLIDLNQAKDWTVVDMKKDWGKNYPSKNEINDKKLI